MNTKRQTIWLVSMLSLMVVLSAYYLFTQESPGKQDLLTDGSQVESGSNATEATTGANQIIVDEVQQPDDTAITDKEVLQQMEAQGGFVSSDFAEALQKQDEQKNSESDKLLAVIANTPKISPEESSAAVKELASLEDKYTKITSIETELMKEFHSAVVDEENDRFRVLVASDKLEKSQAADIIDLVMKTLEVNADQVTVQFVP